MKPRKYRKGNVIDTIGELIPRLKAGEYVYYRDRLLHPTFILNMTFATVIGAAYGQRIFRAILNEEADNDNGES